MKSLALATRTALPAFGFATSTAAGVAACIATIAGRSSAGPRPQLPPIATAPSALRSFAACSGLTPIIVWPWVSKLIVTTIGTPGAAWRAPSTAASTSSSADIVSIQKTSTPPAWSAAACSAKPFTASARSRSPSGARIAPLGPMSPATTASWSGVWATSPARRAAASFSSATRVSSP